MPTPQSLSQASTRSPIAIDAYVHPGHSNDTLVSNTVINSVIATATAAIDVIVGRPLVTYSSVGAVTIQLPYYCRVAAHSITSARLLALQSMLARHLDRPVTLRLTYLMHPYLDANILARYVSDELTTQRFSRVVRKLLSITGPLDLTTAMRIPLPACLLGLSISLDGRLVAEPTRPRMTKQCITIGSVSPSDKSLVQLGSYTTFNMKGAYTVSVCLSTRFSIYNAGLHVCSPLYLHYAYSIYVASTSRSSPYIHYAYPPPHRDDSYRSPVVGGEGIAYK